MALGIREAPQSHTVQRLAALAVIEHDSADLLEELMHVQSSSASSSTMDSDLTWTKVMQRLEHLKRFYSLLGALEDRLSGKRRLSECSGRLPWPKRGVYFFLDPCEVPTDSGAGQRVVRVGTHALVDRSSTTLWNRLSQHRGPMRSGGGNHRGSIFRLLVGTALINRNGYSCPTWGCGRSSVSPDDREGEKVLERAVSEVIGKMPFLWLAVEDKPGPDSQRGYIERNAIALLSNYGKPVIDRPSKSWLGHHCSREKVKNSGLWNQNHAHGCYDPAFLDVFETLTKQMEKPG